jgi:MFS transporter, DHA1 family, inner membrane transport protein
LLGWAEPRLNDFGSMTTGQIVSRNARLPARGLVPTLALSTFVNHLNVVAWIPFLPFIAQAQSVSASLLGQIPASMLLLSALLGLAIGPLADRYGYRRTLLVCLVAVAASSLTTGLSTTIIALFPAALLGSVGRAAVMPVAQATATASFVEVARRRRAISRIQSGAPLAATLGIPLLTTLAIVLSWRGAFLVISALAVGTALAVRYVVGPDETVSAGLKVRLKGIFAGYQPLFQHRPTVVLLTAACVENIGVNAMWTYYGAFYVERYGFGTDQVGWMSLAAGLGVLIGQTAAGGRLGAHSRHLFIAGCVGSGSLIGLSLILPLSAVAAITLMAAGWLTHGMVMVSTVILLVDRSPAGRAVTLTLNSSAQSFGWAVGAGTGGMVLAAAGYVALGVWTLVLPLGSALLMFFGRPSRGRV